MLEFDDPHGPKRRGEEHDRWLAMQSAYAEYRRASEALECAFQFAYDSTASESIRLTVLECQQRVAFERYLEARMDFLEFHFDERNWSGPGPVAPLKHDSEDCGVSSPSVFATCLPIVKIVGVILLCTTAFFLIREQKHARTLNQTRDGVQLHGQKLDNGTPPQQAVIQYVGNTSPSPSLLKPAATPQTTARKPPVARQRRRQPVRRVQAKQADARRELVPETQSQKSGVRDYYSFSLTRSRQFKRVGPIKVSLWSVDSRRRYVWLSIQSNSMQIDVKRLQLNQPVWINVSAGEQPLELVVDRLAGDRLDGHLVEPRNNNKAELRAGRFKSTLPASP